MSRCRFTGRPCFAEHYSNLCPAPVAIAARCRDACIPFFIMANVKRCADPRLAKELNISGFLMRPPSVHTGGAGGAAVVASAHGGAAAVRAQGGAVPRAARRRCPGHAAGHRPAAAPAGEAQRARLPSLHPAWPMCPHLLAGPAATVGRAAQMLQVGVALPHPACCRLPLPAATCCRKQLCISMPSICVHHHQTSS